MRRFSGMEFTVPVVLAALTAGGCVSAPPGPKTPELYALLRAASVSVLVNGRMHGSGFFVTPDGLVATAAHVVKGKPQKIELLSASLGRMAAEIVAVDASHDIALLAAPPRKRAYPAMAVSTRIAAPGERVFLMGNPMFRHDVLLSGTVAVGGPTYCYSTDLQCYVRAVYVSGPSPKGTSGGCWVDARRRVVGVQSGYLGEGKVSAGLATVGCSDGLAALIAARKSPEVATLGSQIDELWTQPSGFITRFDKGARGIVTVRPQKDGPVAKAGLNKESLISAIDGRGVLYCDELLEIVRSKRPGETLTLTVVDPDHRPGRSVKVRLAAIAQ